MKWGISVEVSKTTNRAYDSKGSHPTGRDGSRDILERTFSRCRKCRRNCIISGTGISIEDMRSHIRKARILTKGKG